ncbi:hypothetical protein IWQ60_011742 [Tieghemiomyces parasiticus]|uniref:Mitochondrial genome maintenance protein MGM101 n=1 Tax=Tieghemiomyces parasiticus TaxID=78921 RepID=A0A9W7ZPX0_9FUNG|nr:hypothetical protein IWQ60_011742 [Tieghemiomyces parasiticus]
MTTSLGLRLISRRPTQPLARTLSPARAYAVKATLPVRAAASTSSSAVKMAFPESPVFLASPNDLVNQTGEAGSLPNGRIDWTKSFYGVGQEPFPQEVREILMAPVDASDVEMKVDGLIYLPEIKYRRILNRAFGPGGWGLAPRGPHTVSPSNISREYALICRGRFVAQARGEQDYFSKENIATATEGCKSNALMRCCKDLGVSSELWDPVFIREFKQKYCTMEMAEHVTRKTRKMLWRRKDRELEYPYKKVTGK